MEGGRFKRVSDFEFDVIIEGSKMVEGDISCEGNVKVNCPFSGIINSKGVVFIGRGGEVQADIRCFAMIIEGKVKGRIIATKKIEVRRAGVLSGNIECDMVAMEEDSFVMGFMESTKGDKPLVKRYEEKRKKLRDEEETEE